MQDYEKEAQGLQTTWTKYYDKDKENSKPAPTKLLYRAKTDSKLSKEKKAFVVNKRINGNGDTGAPRHSLYEKALKKYDS